MVYDVLISIADIPNNFCFLFLLKKKKTSSRRRLEEGKKKTSLGVDVETTSVETGGRCWRRKADGRAPESAAVASGRASVRWCPDFCRLSALSADGNTHSMTSFTPLLLSFKSTPMSFIHKTNVYVCIFIIAYQRKETPPNDVTGIIGELSLSVYSITVAIVAESSIIK